MSAVAVENPREPAVGKWWWVLLVTGILWILIGLFVLQSHYDSAVLIGYLVAFWLIFAAVTEFMELAVLEGWKWLHAIIGVLFLVGGIAALTSPFQTFMVLAALIGFFLVLKGTFDFTFAILLRHDLELWWMTLVAGILEILLGIWAMGYPGRSSALLILWIGIGAIIRGTVEIIGSFQLKKDPGAVDVVVAAV
jgi:uncharacterized membrane protein HdeD (DUF308 family)